MIVDDHADVRYLIRAIVEDADGGADVVVAGEADGVRAALESIDQVDPDVVVLDALMPVVGGLEAAPMILARRPGQLILMCSAFVDDDLRRQGGGRRHRSRACPRTTSRRSRDRGSSWQPGGEFGSSATPG